MIRTWTVTMYYMSVPTIQQWTMSTENWSYASALYESKANFTWNSIHLIKQNIFVIIINNWTRWYSVFHECTFIQISYDRLTVFFLISSFIIHLKKKNKLAWHHWLQFWSSALVNKYQMKLISGSCECCSSCWLNYWLHIWICPHRFVQKQKRAYL